MSYPTVCRYLTQESESATPQPDKAIAILSVISKDDYPFLKSMLQKINGADSVPLFENIFSSENIEIKDSKITSVFRNENTCIAFCLAGRSTGVSGKEIEEITRKAGKDALAFLVDNDFVQRRQDIYFANEFSLTSLETISALFDTGSKLLNKNVDFMKKNYFISSETGGLNADGYKKYLSVLFKATSELEAIRKNENFKGDIGFINGFYMTPIDSREGK